MTADGEIQPQVAGRLPTPVPFVWGSSGLAQAYSADASWLWHGYLASGAITLLTSQWKAGKTTLLSVLLKKLGGGGRLAGLPVAPARAIVVSEEGTARWAARDRQLAFGGHVGWVCRPFRGRPKPGDWIALIEQITELHAAEPIGLVVIDPLAPFLSTGGENNAACMLEALVPLQQLTSAGVAVLVNHHPRKGLTSAGQAARGSGALSGFVDILVEMHWLDGPAAEDRRRRLRAFSRYPETPPDLVVELSADGTDYTSLGAVADADFTAHWAVLESIFREADNKLTRQTVRRRWAADSPPDKATVARWLERAVAQSLLRREGVGHKGEPFRYWLPAREAEWRKDPLACLRMPEFWDVESPAAEPPVTTGGR